MKGFSPQVKAAMITVGGTLIVTAIVTFIGWLGSSSENSRLKEKVHDLELEVLPFRNLAVQEFRKSDAESMRRLAELMAKLHKAYTNQIDTINALRNQVEQLNKASQEVDHTLFSRMTNETFSFNDTNHVLIVQDTNGLRRHLIRLSHPPVYGSIEISAMSGITTLFKIHSEAFPKTGSEANLALCLFADADSISSYSCNYCIDTRNTNFCDRMPKPAEVMIQRNGWFLKPGSTSF